MTSGRSVTFTSVNATPLPSSSWRFAAQYGHPVFTYSVTPAIERRYHDAVATVTPLARRSAACESRGVDDESASETIDVVDEEDHVVGRATRREMRERNLLHRAVYIFVINSLGDLFVHRRTATKDVYPGYWDVCVGGVVMAGESYDAAAEREIAEELGVMGTPVRSLGKLRFEDAATRIHGAVYAATNDGPFVLQAEEIMSGAFVTRAELERILAEERCCPDGVSAWRAYGTRLRDG